MAQTKKPTIAELERLLSEPDGVRKVTLNPNGSLTTELTDRAAQCVNALAGVSDPAALVASWRELLDVVKLGELAICHTVPCGPQGHGKDCERRLHALTHATQVMPCPPPDAKASD